MDSTWYKYKDDKEYEITEINIGNNQKNVKIYWKVIQESIPCKLIEVTKMRGKLPNKFGFNNLLMFLFEFRYNKNE